MKRAISLMLSLAIFLPIMPSAIAEEDYGENLCLGKEVYADTIYQDQQTFAAINANDGNLNTTTATGSNSGDIRNGFQNYIVVDLGDIYKLNRVIIRSRRDLDADWARQGYAAYLATKEDFSDAVQVGAKDWAGAFKSDLDVEMKEPYSARYVIAANINKTGGATIGEIEAYGEEASIAARIEYKDISGKAKNAAMLLNALGVMEGVSNTEFGSVNLITRGEAAMYMCRYAKAPMIDNYKEVFEDVDSSHQYASYIYSALEYGMIAYDTHFRPDDYIKGCELVRMILCVNGYDALLQNNSNDYPYNIVDVANIIDLLDNVKSDCMSYISKSDAAMLMHNALITITYESKIKELSLNEETLLEKIYGYTLMNGIVTGNGATSLNVPYSSVQKKSIKIDNVQYLDENGLGMNYLGERVYFLTDEESTLHSLYTDDSKNDFVTVYDHEIMAADFDAIEIYTDGKRKRYKIDAHPYTIFNGVADSDISEADLIPEDGYLTLLNNDNDEAFDVIKIYKPEIVFVDSVNIDEDAGEIVLSDISGGVKSLIPDYVKVTDTKGKELALNKIRSGKLIYIYESNNKKLTYVEIQDSPVEGNITAIASDYISINGEMYEFTSYFSNKGTPVKMGKSAKFYLDKNNRLIYMTDESTGKVEDILAVVRKAVINPDEDSNIFNIYDEQKQFRSLKLADRVKVNDMQKDLYQVQALGRNYFEGKIVLLTIIGDNVVKSIITEDYANGEIYKSNISLNDSYRGNSGFYSGSKLVLPISDNVPLFTIPIDKATGRPGVGSDYDRLYNVRDLSEEFKIRARLGANNIGVYGLNEFGEATVLVNRCYYSEESSSYGVITSYSSSGAMIFDNIQTNCNADDEIYYTLNGYDLTTGRARKIITEPGLNKVVNTFKIRNVGWFEHENIPNAYLPDSTWFHDTKILKKEKVNSYFLDDIQSLQRGDIIRYDNGGYDGVTQLELIVENMDFDESKCQIVYNAGDSPETIMATYRLQYAIAEQIKDGHIKFLYQQGSYEILDLSRFEGSVIVVNGLDFETYPVTSAGICISKGDRIVVYSNASYHKSIVVYK